MAKFEWTQDKGNLGDFGGADYFHALTSGGTKREQLRKTRDAIRDWARTNPKGKTGQTLKRSEWGIDPATGKTFTDVDWGSRSAFFGSETGDLDAAGKRKASRVSSWLEGPVGVGYTGFGDYSKGKQQGQYYDLADLYGGLAEGQSWRDIQKHFQNTANLGKIRSGSNILQKIAEGAREETEKSLKTGFHQETRAALKPLEQRIADLGGQVTDLTGQKSTLISQRDQATSSLGVLQTKYDTELQQLKKAAAAVRQSSPTKVMGGSPTSIRFRQSPTKGGFRGTLAGLTRSSGPANKLKSTQVSI